MVDWVDRWGFPEAAESEQHDAGTVEAQVSRRNPNMLKCSKASDYCLMGHCNGSTVSSNLQDDEGEVVRKAKGNFHDLSKTM